MPAGPSRLLERFFGILIPPACREEVLGDLCERYSSPAQYIFLAIRTIPCVVFSRACRVTEAPILFVQALLVYGCYVAAAFYRDSAFLYGPWGLLRAALPALPFLIVTVLFDVYGAPVRSSLQLAGRVALATLIAFLTMTRFGWPYRMNLLGASASLVLVTGLRFLFRPHPSLGQAGGAADWLKQTASSLLPVDLTALIEVVRTWWNEKSKGLTHTYSQFLSQVQSGEVLKARRFSSFSGIATQNETPGAILFNRPTRRHESR